MSDRARRAGRCATGLALACGLVFAAAACASDEEDDAAADGATTEGGATDQPAADTILGEPNAATGSPIRIGFANAEGGAAVSFPAIREGAEAAVEYVNEYLGGIGGRPIELDVCMDRSDGASGTACANQFVQEDVAAVAVGTIANPDLYIPVLQGAGIPYVRMQAAGGGAALSSPISFTINGGFIVGHAAMASLAADRGYEKVVYFGIDVPTFTAGFNTFGQPAYDNAGVEAEVIGIPPGTPDATAQVAAGMAEDPDLIVVAGDGVLCQAVVPAIENANVNDVPVLLGDACMDPAVVSAVGEDTLEGDLVLTAFVGGDGEEEALFRAVLEKFAPDTAPTGSVASGYGAVLAIVRAVNQVAPTEVNASTVAEALRGAGDVPQPAVSGATFTCDGQALPQLPALCSTSVIIATVSGGILTEPEVVDGSEYLPR